jgi:hypothetical protein
VAGFLFAPLAGWGRSRQIRASRFAAKLSSRTSEASSPRGASRTPSRHGSDPERTSSRTVGEQPRGVVPADDPSTPRSRHRSPAGPRPARRSARLVSQRRLS